MSMNQLLRISGKVLRFDEITKREEKAKFVASYGEAKKRFSVGTRYVHVDIACSSVRQPMPDFATVHSLGE